MKEWAQQFVEQRERLVAAGLGWRVPEDLRRLAVGFGHRALAAGESLGAAASALGVSRATLQRWLEESPGEEPGVLREVVIRETPGQEDGSTATVTLVTPEGFRIEGLRSGDLPELLRSLR